jgi:hypothetical protein
VSTEREAKLHDAICQAVSIMNMSIEIARSKDGRQAKDILRQALVDYADDFMEQPTSESEQLAMRRLHK